MKKWYANAYVIVVVTISLMGIAVSSLLFLLIPQSGEVLLLMQRRMVAAKTYYVETDVRWRGEHEAVDGTAKESVAFSSAGWRDMTDPAAVRSQETFSLAIGAEQPVSFKGEHVGLDDTHFLRFSALPDRIGTLHFSDYRDRWLRLDTGTLLKETALPLVGGATPPLSVEARVELTEQFRRTPFLSVAERLKSETISGAQTHHYKVVPEILFFKDHYMAAERARLGRDLTGKERLAADAFFADLSPEDGEIWIGKRDYYLYRIRLRFRYDDGKRDGTFDLTIDFSRFNQPPMIAGPTEGVTDVTPLLASLLQGLQSHLPLAKDGTVPRGTAESGSLGLPVDYAQPGQEDPDQDGLVDSLEGFYGTDRNNPDTDADGMNDGDEVKEGRNPSGTGLLFDFTGGKF